MALDSREARLEAALQGLLVAVTYHTPVVNYGPDNPCWKARVPVQFVDDARAAIAATARATAAQETCGSERCSCGHFECQHIEAAGGGYTHECRWCACTQFRSAPPGAGAAPQTEAHAYCHDLVCNASREHPRGAKGVGCSCRYRDAVAASEWRDISTAPKDGTHVLLWCVDENGDGIEAVGAWFGGWANPLNGKLMAWEDDPTHWMPLPEPPLQVAGEETTK